MSLRCRMLGHHPQRRAAEFVAQVKIDDGPWHEDIQPADSVLFCTRGKHILFHHAWVLPEVPERRVLMGGLSIRFPTDRL